MSKSETIERKFIESFDASEWEIETDTGWEPVTEVHKTIPYLLYTITTESGKFLKCADDHILFTENFEEIFAKDCITNKTHIITKDGPELVTGVINENVHENMYDITVDSDNHRFFTNDILSHNTTAYVGYILWYLLFHDFKNIVLLADKEGKAKDILKRVKLAYEHVPFWMQQGVKEWNKKSLEIENGSKMSVDSTAGTSARSGSINCVSENSYITTKNKKTGVIETVTINELKSRLKDGEYLKKPKINFYENTDYEILTPDGFKDFAGISETQNQTIKIVTENNELYCTKDHKIYSCDINDYVKAELLTIGNTVKTQIGPEKITKIINGGVKTVCDLVDVKDTHAFFANNIDVHNCLILDEFAFVAENVVEDFFKSVYPTVSKGKDTKIIIVSTPHGINKFYKMWTDATSTPAKNDYSPFRMHWSETPGRDEAWKENEIRNFGIENFNQEYGCEFFGSVANTLINSQKLRDMVYIDPIHVSDDHNLEIYEMPIKNSAYTICVDVARGDKNNFSAFTVIKTSSVPYQVVAKYRSDKVAPIVFPDIVVDIAKKYNEAFILVEINDIGGQIVDIIKFELEYENLFSTLVDKKLSLPKLSIGEGRGYKLGIRTTHSTKRIGCANLKSMIEEDQLIINDFDIKSELTNFVSKGGSYMAEKGANDDLVMSLVLFGWLTSQKYFKELTNQNLKSSLTKSVDDTYKDIPFVFVDTHQGDIELPEDKIIDTGDLWLVSEEEWDAGYDPDKYH